jgi:glycosyltransferase involved in cell wall biosynthesis
VGIVQKNVVVVPCYNEEERLKDHEFLPFLERDATEIVFVNDGSGDQTSRRLHSLAARGSDRIHVLELAQNSGKAEAVRHGMLRALELGADIVGYMDADASTPASEILRLLDALRTCDADVVMGARVQLLGHDVQRLHSRHYLGRVFATAASMVLALPVYDTQCGAKFFRDTAALRLALATPFTSRWIFDVELLGRLLMGADDVTGIPAERFLEVPLRVWCDVAGSKLGVKSMLRSGLELAVVGARLRRVRVRRGRRR